MVRRQAKMLKEFVLVGRTFGDPQDQAFPAPWRRQVDDQLDVCQGFQNRVEAGGDPSRSDFSVQERGQAAIGDPTAFGDALDRLHTRYTQMAALAGDRITVVFDQSNKVW